MPLASWWKRFVALLIDSIIIGLGILALILVISIVGVALSGNHPAATGNPQASTTTSSADGLATLGGFIVIWLIGSIPVGLYYAFMNGSRRGQTVGKMALSIAVRDSRNGERINFCRAFAQFYTTVLFQLLFFLPYLLDSLAPLWNSRRQAWHDKVARTIVVDLKP